MGKNLILSYFLGYCFNIKLGWGVYFVVIKFYFGWIKVRGQYYRMYKDKDQEYLYE